ncbi:MAG TPA: hypothetical protein VFF11_00475, partial [Candidatus Binatia bacterium]|nr:hypothetical protein [Candidatus Binatia bacterium]
SKQLDAIQSQLAALPPVLDKLEKKYFTESQDKALFYHTNALYFLVTIDKRIQAQFDQAAAARKASDQLAYFYHTNQTDTAYFCASQIADAITAQEKQIEDNINKTVQEANSALSNNFTAQIKTLAADKAQLQAEVAKRAEMEAKLNQIQTELDQIKALLQKINQPQPGPPATQP